MTLRYDPELARRALVAADPQLGALIERVGPCGLRRSPATAPFPALSRSIVYQQLSGKAAGTILRRVLDLFPDGYTPEALLALPDAPLRAAGLSRAKLAALRDLAARVASGAVPTPRRLAQLDDEAVIEQLTEVRGVGRWTVEMYLMFGLGRPDVLPVTDLGVRKGFQLVYGMRRLPATVTMQRRAEAWRPWRSVASWYLWRAAEGA
jgi:3-methyladenine DNA glycosylase/8-oxoguanine DNA glycosylase